MPPGAADLLANMLALSLRDRAKGDAAEAWFAELEQRVHGVRSGSVATEEWEAVKVRLAQRWHRR